MRVAPAEAGAASYAKRACEPSGSGLRRSDGALP
jgi:hypothetical protein